MIKLKSIINETIERFTNKLLMEKPSNDPYGRIKPSFPSKPGELYGTTPIYKKYTSGVGKSLKVGHEAIETGTANIDAQNSDVIYIIKQLKSAPANSNIRVTGSASAVGNSNPKWGLKKNQKLALDRANALIKILKSRLGDKFTYEPTFKVGDATKPESKEALAQQSVEVQIQLPSQVPGGVERDNTAVMLRTGGTKLIGTDDDDDDTYTKVKYKRVCIKVRDGMPLQALLKLLKNYKGMYSVRDYPKQ